MRALQKFLNTAEEKRLDLYYAQVRRGGKVVDTWGVGDRLPAMIRMESFSASKGFVGMGVGIAIDEGLITLEEKVADSFPEYTYNLTNPNILDVTVRDLLTMTVGAKAPLFFRDSAERAREKDWARYIYQNGEYICPPGEKFVYNNANTYMLGRLVAKKYGQNMLEYMRYRLFEPLGIGNPDMTTCPMGHTVGANGMAINVDELGRFGQMVLDGGVYNGKRIVSEAYIRDALTEHAVSAFPAFSGEEGKFMGWGYHALTGRAGDLEYAAFFGTYGQTVLICPEKEAVISTLALHRDTDGFNRHVFRDILMEL